MRLVSVRNLPVLMHSSTSWASASSLADVVGVAGGDQRQAHPLGDLDRRFHGQPLDLQAVVLDLDEVAVAEDAVEPGGDLGLPSVSTSRAPSRRVAGCKQRAAELAARRSR